MTRKPKVTVDPKPPKRKMTQAEQSALFIETARKLGAGETEEDFEKAFDRVVLPRAKGSPPNSD
jgi:hypothetical protein